MTASALSSTMQAALDLALGNEGKLVRHPGGFWRGATVNPWANTSTVQALVRRRVMIYSDWKQTKNSRFPIEASVIEDFAPKEKTE